MPFPSYIPRSDSFGNWYFGGFQINTSLEAGIGANTGLSATQTQFDAFLDAALGPTNWARNGNNYYFKFANPWETLTGTTTITSNYRFSIVSNSVKINTSISGVSLSDNDNTFNITNLYSSTGNSFCVANQYGMWLCNFNDGSTSNTLQNTSSPAIYLGWLKKPVFPTDTNERVRNIIIGQGRNSTSTWFVNTRAANSTADSGACAIRTGLSCKVNTPGANIGDITVIDPASSNLALGNVHNSLLSAAALGEGTLYRIPPSKDPDGNTEQNIWLCVCNQIRGINASSAITTESKSILIRVWSNNIT